MKTKERKSITKLDLLNATNSNTIKEACDKLGITTSAYRKWKKKGLSKKNYNKYFGS